MYIDASVVGTPLSATPRDLSDIVIDDDSTVLDEFLESTTLTSGQLDPCLSPVLLLNPVQLSDDKFFGAFVAIFIAFFEHSLAFLSSCTFICSVEVPSLENTKFSAQRSKFEVIGWKKSIAYFAHQPQFSLPCPFPRPCAEFVIAAR